MKKNNLKNQGKKLIILIFIILLLDQITKLIFYKMRIPSNIVDKSSNGYYIIISIIIVSMLIRFIRNDNLFVKTGTKIVLSFGIAGAIGNAIDRIWNKDVIVFIKLGNFININLAYIYIIIAWVGMALILTKNSFKFFKDRKNKEIINEEFEKNKHLIKDKHKEWRGRIICKI